MSPRPGVHAGHPGEYRACKAPECVRHRDRYRKRWAYERSHGMKRLVDAGPARARIESLVGAGWSYRAISGAANVSPTTVHRVGRGLQSSLQRAVAARIMAVAGLPEQPASGSTEPFVPKVGAVRRIQALLYMGWRHEDIGMAAGLRTAVVLHQQGRWITRTTHDRIAAAFDRLAMTAGPSERTRRRARRLGYLGPLDWDDIDLDAEPARLPGQHRKTDLDPVVVERVLAGDRHPMTAAERHEVVIRARDLGWSYQQIEARTGITKPERIVAQERAAS